jgi:preprotein translocase subunit SecA
VVQREIERVQRIVEGEHGDIRQQLMRFALPLERQRQGIREWRDEVLEGRAEAGLLAERSPERWAALVTTCGEPLLEAVERRLTLHAIDRCWSEHLALMQAERDEVHLVLLDGRDPLTEMYRRARAAHERLLDRIDETVVELFERIEITPDGVDWEREGLRAPSSTWTYLVNDTDFRANPFMTLAHRPAIGLWAVLLWGPLLMLWGAWLHLKRWRDRGKLRLGG